MHGDVFGLAQLFYICERKLDRVVDEAVHLQPEFLESSLGQLLPIVALGHLAVRPEARRDVPLGVMLIGWKAVERGQQQRVRDELLHVLQETRVKPRDVMRRDPGE